MKLFLDRNKTLLPRIDVIFVLTRVMIFLVLCWQTAFADYSSEDFSLFLATTVTYAILLGVFGAAMLGRFNIKLAYLGSIIYDLVFLPLFVLNTGGMDSPFLVFFYLTVSVAAYILTFYFALAVTFLLSVAYLLALWISIDSSDLFGVTIRIGFLWVAFLALSYVAEYMRKSEKRLIKVFDTLNLRTAELEKSQAQLEMIYENTRILAGMLDPDSVVREVMKILGFTLQYEQYALVQRDKEGLYYFRARCVAKTTSFHTKALQVADDDLIDKVSSALESVRVNDINTRSDYRPLSKKARSAILVPLTSHGQSQGLLIAESPHVGFFKDRDEKLLSVVARSAGLALENSELHRRTEELTIIDELTEAYNYRYFIQKFQEEKKRAVRYNLPLSIIMVDIDWFKKLNDTYGHETGNIVLKSLARTIKRCVRDVDIFARYGGEEFVVILPQTPQAEAFHIGERIRSQVENQAIDVGAAGKLKITVSVGVSSYPENGRSEEELISVADEALYQAKGSGKNLVCAT